MHTFFAIGIKGDERSKGIINTPTIKDIIISLNVDTP